MKLRGKTVLITGAARRIGREIALTLAKRGASIVVHYHRSRADALRLQKEIRAQGGEALLVPADFSFSKKALGLRIRRFVGEVTRKAGRIDVLVNNASIFYPTPFGKISEKNWDDFLTVNLKAPFLLSQEIGMRMLRQKSGKIVNLVDGMGLKPAKHYLAYGISKAGLIAATIGLARVLAPYVQVAGIAPGPILPPAGMKPKDMRKVAAHTLLKRFGHPRDIAQTVRYFIEDTDFVTGAFLPVDGGALVS